MEDSTCVRLGEFGCSLSSENGGGPGWRRVWIEEVLDDLELVSKNMRTYATAWVHPKRKLSTSVDTQGNNNPTWNDKFVFRVDDEFLRRDTSAVMIEIYAVHWFRDTLVGTVRVLVDNLIPSAYRPTHHHHHHVGMRFAALQVRRPSGRPQGILNIGVTVLDSSMRSMPLYTQLSASAVGYRDLMEDDSHNQGNNNNNNNHTSTNVPVIKPILRRSRSERSERITFDDLSTTNGSIVGVPEKKGKASSLLSASELSTKSKRGKASSVISGAEFKEQPKEKGKKGKASSLINGSIVSKDSFKPKAKNEKEKRPSLDSPKDKVPNEKVSDPITTNKQNVDKSPTKNSGLGVGSTTTKEKPISKFEFGGPKGSSIVNGKYIYKGAPHKAHSFWSDSEVGPSPSEVAAAVAREREWERYPLDDNESSVLDGWSIDESVEGLRSKLERWRTELPPLYDRGGFGGSSYRSTSQHIRRHTDDGSSGLFSCFGNIYGYECQCICGKPPEGKRSLSGRFQSPSASAGRSFL
ncbi:hypothetical protein HYC85_012689 [Camellia sinensis]|uniref:C2 domain-containing protein n=1 Tax=Camellia sinensis TaxID=4442 RepID=A0A7J7HFS7_CAMSI|nr:hypothetical protein HYC85_012689 [Camellia sinensis]